MWPTFAVHIAVEPSASVRRGAHESVNRRAPRARLMSTSRVTTCAGLLRRHAPKSSLASVGFNLVSRRVCHAPTGCGVEPPRHTMASNRGHAATLRLAHRCEYRAFSRRRLDKERGSLDDLRLDHYALDVLWVLHVVNRQRLLEGPRERWPEEEADVLRAEWADATDAVLLLDRNVERGVPAKLGSEPVMAS